MGRTCIVDSKIQQYIESIADTNGWNIGLIIGQLSVQKDYVIHLATSKGIFENDSEPTLSKPESLEAVNDLTIANHARQVKRMLTGGLDVIGIYAVAETEHLKTLQGKLRQLLFSIHKALNKSEVVPTCHWDRVLLQICSRTRNLTCRTFDVKDPKSSATPCDWKYQKIMDSFISLSTSFSLESVIPISSEALSHTLQKQMMIGLQPVYDNIWNSLATVNSHLVEDDSLPICPKSLPEQSRGRGKKSAKDDEQAAHLESFDINLLQELRLEHEGVKGPEVLDCGAKMLIRGTISSQAYVHVKASAAEAIQAVKRDMIRSIVARCDLLCDDLLQAEEEQDVRVLYETPQRVYADLPDTHIKFCDYLFPDETLDDSAERFRILLEFDLDPEDVDASAEPLPEESDLVRPKRQVKMRNAGPSEVTEAKKKSSPLLKYLGVATAAVAGIVSYWLATQEDVL